MSSCILLLCIWLAPASGDNSGANSLNWMVAPFGYVHIAAEAAGGVCEDAQESAGAFDFACLSLVLSMAVHSTALFHTLILDTWPSKGSSAGQFERPTYRF